MRSLPLTDPGAADLRSPARFLLRVLRLQTRTIAGGVTFGVLWMTTQAVLPFAIGRAVDTGLTGADSSALLLWCGVIAALGLVQAGAGVLRHRFAVTNWLIAFMRTIQWVAGQTARMGSSLAAQVSTGEVVSVGATDTVAIARAMDITARTAGSLVAFALVAALLLHSSVTLGLVVLIGVPVFSLLLGPLLRPLHTRQGRQRAAMGSLTGLGADTVVGLRVLRGIGGESEFLSRYRAQSQRVRRSGTAVARTQSVLDAAQVLVPGTFVVLVTWLGARFAVRGQITAGELVAFYGYAAFLLTPLRNLLEATDKVTRALVAARRLIHLLALDPVLSEPIDPASEPPVGAALADALSGLTVSPGRLTAVVTDETAEATALADRLGRYVDGPVTLGGVALSSLPTALVRRRILVVDTQPVVFSGRLRDELDPTGLADDDAVTAALQAADAHDVLDALPDRLDTVLSERGRSLSGGQRQRLVLARALLADPEILVLVEPTSAVDAHTEARIAQRLRAARSGRTTVVFTASPLVLDQVDAVALLSGGRVVAGGSHRELLDLPSYRRVVTRAEVPV